MIRFIFTILRVGNGSIELLSVRIICCSNDSSDQHDGLDLLFIGEESNRSHCFATLDRMGEGGGEE